MPETTTEVRADIEQTRTRMSHAITELERKVDLAQQVRDHPWASIGVAFGAGLALSASSADMRAARVTSDAARQTGSKLGTALDGLIATLVTAVTSAVNDRIDGAVHEVVTSIRGATGTADGTRGTRSVVTPEPPAGMPVRAD